MDLGDVSAEELHSMVEHCRHCPSYPTQQPSEPPAKRSRRERDILLVKGSEWCARQAELGLDNVNAYQGVLDSFISCFTPLNHANVETERTSFGAQLVGFANERAIETKLQTVIKRFWLLLFASYCAILDQMATRPKVIDELMDASTSIKKSYRLEVTTAALNIHRFINELVKKGLPRCRATEFIFLNALRPATLFTVSRKTLDAILADSNDLIQYKYDDCVTARVFIPELLDMMFRKANMKDMPTYDVICRHLGYMVNSYERFPLSVFSPQNKQAQCLVRFVGAVGPISKFVLLHACEPQRRWTEDGKEEVVALRDAGFYADYSCFQSTAGLETTLQYCVQKSMMAQDENADWLTCNSTSASDLRSDLPFLTYIFPHGWLSDIPSAQPIKKALIDILRPVWSSGTPTYHLMSSRDYDYENLIEVCIEASKIVEAEEKSATIDLALKLCRDGNPQYLKYAIAHRRSQISRYEGNLDRSDEIAGAYPPPSRDASLKAHCFFQLLMCSRAENAILREDFEEATAILSRCTLLNKELSLPLHVMRTVNTAMGRVLRYQGDFKHAVENFSTCFGAVGSAMTTRRHILHHLWDCYCEQDLSFWVVEGFQSMAGSPQASSSPISRKIIRLSLPLAEAFLRQQEMGKAYDILVRAQHFFEERGTLSATDEVEHVRTLLGLVRVHKSRADWQLALRDTKEAIRLIERYNTFVDGSFYRHVSLLFLATVYRKLARRSEAEEAALNAQECVQVRRHFMPGIGTYVYDSLLRELASAPPSWPIAPH